MAIKTYDNYSSKIGIYDVNEKEPLAPIGHIVTGADIEVTIDCDGKFISAAERDKKEKVIIPVTEESAGRTSAPAAHPLCDQIQYLSEFDEKSEECYELYFLALSKWAESECTTKSIDAILKYVEKKTLDKDLLTSGIIKDLDKERKKMIIWRVLGVDEPAVWKDKTLMEKYSEYYQTCISYKTHNLCMVDGKNVVTTTQHMKGIFSLNGNAKLISSNDSTNFTYRGRFGIPDEALSIGYEASQKAHCALKWLISNYGAIVGGRSYLCWSPECVQLPKLHRPLLKFSKDVTNKYTNIISYKSALEKELLGYKSNIQNIDTSKTIITSFDAATSGRLSMTMYDEMDTKSFFEKLKQWDEDCSWFYYNAIESPALSRIVDCTFGTERADGIEADDRVRKEQINRLIQCRLGRALFPTDIEKEIVRKASNPQAYKNNYKMLLSTACAVIRKYKKDYLKEEWKMELESDRKDRSYQFGRLLAVYEKMERDTYANNESRDTNANRLQSVYCNQPFHYAFELEKIINRAYFPRLKPGVQIFYRNLIAEIIQSIHETPEDTWNKPLGDTYLMGYYLQNKSLYTSKTKDEE